MIQVSEEQIKDFLEKEFPGQPYSLGQGYWFVQAGKCLGKNLHYEYQAEKVHLHIEGSNWRGILNYLWTHVMDSRVSHSHWGRYSCNWTLDTNPQTWEELKITIQLNIIFLNHMKILEM